MPASLTDDRFVFRLQEIVQDLPKSLFTHAQSGRSLVAISRMVTSAKFYESVLEQFFVA